MTSAHPRFSVAKIAAGLAVLGLLAGGVFYVWREQTPVPQADVEAFLDATQGSGHLHFSVARLVTLQKGEKGAQVAVVATGIAPEPLFTAIGTSDYLARAFGAAPRSAPDAQRILTEGAPRAAVPENPYQATILTPNAPAGSTFEFQGIVDVRGRGSNRALTLVSGGFVGPGPQGEPRSAFKGPTYVAGDTQDDGRLRKLVADVETLAKQKTPASLSLPPAQLADVEGRRSAFLATLAPGRILRGLATETGLEQGTTLYLEIVDVSRDGGVRALLRNEGGWELARSFLGTVGPVESFEAAALTLVSHPNQAVRGGGPVLEDAQAWSLALRWNPAQGLSGESRHYDFQFQFISDQEASEARASLAREYDSAVDATAPGTLLIGSATARASGASEPILLRFMTREGRGTTLGARIESTTQTWQRSLGGTILANSRRSGGDPIRLEADANSAVQVAPPESVFGWRDGLQIRFGADQGSLLGEDEHFTYKLAVATGADLHRLEAERQERLAHLAAIFRPGIALDGTFHEEQGFTTVARIEVEGVDRQTGVVSAQIDSRGRLGVHREFKGNFDPSGSALVLTATERGSFRADEDFDVPFLKAGVPSTVRLSPLGNSLVGQIEGDPSWKIGFPLAVFLAAPVEPLAPNTEPKEPREYPPPPKEGGAYLLRDGSWVALPKNLGHFVTENIKPNADLHLSLNVIDLLGQGIGLVSREKDKKSVIFFQFDGKDPRPLSRGGATTLLFVGSEPKGKPPIELARAEVQKDGSRRVLKAGGPPESLRFGETRVAAYVRQVSPGCFMLTTTSSLEPGPYAFNADTGYELTRE
jgi:hypothetical protein